MIIDIFEGENLRIWRDGDNIYYIGIGPVTISLDEEDFTSTMLEMQDVGQVWNQWLDTNSSAN